MSGSVGTVKIPIVSTFDASGVTAAKQGLKELQQAQPAGAGGPSSGGAGATGGASPVANLARAASQRLANIANAIPGGEGLGSLLSAAGVGTAAAGVAVFALSQRVAGNARQVRTSALELGVSTEYYGRIAKSARQAGIDIGEVTKGIASIQQKVQSAALGGDLGQSMFLRSLGISSDDISEGIGNTDKMIAKLRSVGLTAGQKAMLFGSARAGDIAMGIGATGGGGITEPNAFFTGVSSRMGAGLENTATNITGSVGYFLWALSQGGGPLRPEVIQRHADEARQQEENEAAAKRQAQYLQAGIALRPSLASPYESYQYQSEARENFQYSANAGENARMRQLSDLQLREQFADQVASTRSPAENLRAQLRLGAERYNQYDPLTDRTGRVQSIFEAGRMPTSPEQIDVARRMGLQIGEYAERVTHAGGLAGATDVNTAAGYSQMVGAEEAQRQSSDMLAMVRMIIATLDPRLQEQVGKNLGYQFGMFDFLNGAGRR